jgi:phage tail tape-measure protein
MQRLVNMQSQLQEAKKRGEEHDFIDDQSDDLNRLLEDTMWALHKEQAAGAA